MRAFTLSVHIARPRQAVWAYMTDLANSSKWRPFVSRMETVDGQPLAPGSDVRVVMDIMGRTLQRVSRTTVFEPPHRWALHSSSRGIDGTFEYRVEPEGEGSRVVFLCDLTAHGLLPWLSLPLLAWSERRNRREQLPKLKALLETTPVEGSSGHV